MVRWHKIFSFFRNRELIFLAVLLFFSFQYRIWFAGLAYPDPIFDMDRYVALAYQALDGELVAECCDKSAGYPMFIAVIFSIFGRYNLEYIRFIQVLLELGSVLVIYKISRDMLGKSASYLSSILYAVNPLTSSYVGLILPEILTVFIIFLIILIFTRKNFTKNPLLWLFYGMSIGLLIFIRKQFITVSIIFSVYILLMNLRSHAARFRFSLVCVIGFLLISSYSLYTNFVTFKRISFYPPYQFSGYIYLLNYDVSQYPELLLNDQDFEPIYYDLGRDWHGAPIEDKELVNKKYKDLFRLSLQDDWTKIAKNYLRNMFWIWDHNHLFYYYDIWYPGNKVWVRVVNWIYVISALGGIVYYLITNKQKIIHNSLFVYTLVQLSATMFLYTLYSNEARHSIASMGIISLWAGLGIGVILEKFKKRIA